MDPQTPTKPELRERLYEMFGTSLLAAASCGASIGDITKADASAAPAIPATSQVETSRCLQTTVSNGSDN